MPSRNSLICLECGVEMRPEKIGVVVKVPGYNGFFKADIWKCPVCGKEVLTGFGSEFFDYKGRVDIDLSDFGGI